MMLSYRIILSAWFAALMCAGVLTIFPRTRRLFFYATHQFCPRVTSTKPQQAFVTHPPADFDVVCSYRGGNPLLIVPIGQSFSQSLLRGWPVHLTDGRGRVDEIKRRRVKVGHFEFGGQLAGVEPAGGYHSTAAAVHHQGGPPGKSAPSNNGMVARRYNCHVVLGCMLCRGRNRHRRCPSVWAPIHALYGIYQPVAQVLLSWANVAAEHKEHDGLF
mmetsp:Transcript_29262/g.87710  ORF Transcript_29262/g.87710 Transcript_29262/m.87710 type:complete len:216 (+) Transcript_29262:708-1355(+)